MTPIDRCIRKIQSASNQADKDSIQQVVDALKDFEASHASTCEQILALEAVFQFFKTRCRDESRGDFMRWVAAIIDRYQDRVIVASA